MECIVGNATPRPYFDMALWESRCAGVWLEGSRIDTKFSAVLCGKISTLVQQPARAR